MLFGRPLRKAAFLEKALGFWMGSLIECYEKKQQPFSLSGGRFGSRAIKISGWNLPGAGGVENAGKWALQLLTPSKTCSNSQRKSHQFAQIRHFEPQKFCCGQTVRSVRISRGSKNFGFRYCGCLQHVELKWKKLFCSWKSWISTLKERMLFGGASSEVLMAVLWESRAQNFVLVIQSILRATKACIYWLDATMDIRVFGQWKICLG